MMNQKYWCLFHLHRWVFTNFYVRNWVHCRTL